MRCPHCDHINSSQARYCVRCGADLHPAPSIGSSTGFLRPGQTMNHGQYRVVRELGHGGMGAIYLAENTQAFNRLCVIKELLVYYAPGEEQAARARFEREARTLAELKHPGIPDMYGYFSEGGHHYIVMEYIEGEDLEQVIARRTYAAQSPSEELELDPSAADEAVRYAIEICRVLEYLAGIQPEPVVHCDIKPANIIIDRNSGQAVLVDFGTAKARYIRATANAADAEALYGTIGYAAPEMYHGQAVPKSDVFALAATLYHLLTLDDPRDHPYKWPAMERAPAPLRPILQQALAHDVSARCDAETFRRQLEAYRATRAGILQPLTFPDGNVATTVTGVLDLSLRYWDYARRILYDGSLTDWLRRELHDPVTAQQAEEAQRRYPDLPSAGLDAWLRQMNPRLPAPRLSLSTSTRLDLGILAPGQAAKATLTLHNAGPGGSHGAITTSEPWLEASPGEYGLGPGESTPIRFRLRGQPSLPLGEAHSILLRIQPAFGSGLDAELHLRIDRRAAVPKALPRTAPTAAPVTQTSPAAPMPPPSAKSAPSPGRRTLWPVIALIVFLGLVAGGYAAYRRWAAPFLPLPDDEYRRAIDEFRLGLRDGSWREALPRLARVSPQNKEQVKTLGLWLDTAMADVPAGTLYMGREGGTPQEEPVHPVEIQAFRVDLFEVTNAQYQRYVYITGAAPPASWGGPIYRQGEALHPVVGLTWAEAAAYATWAGKRLPTEAEWEWIGRGADGRLYPWGDEEQPSYAHGGPTGKGPARVASKPLDVTRGAVMDLAGNVREWTGSIYRPYPTPANHNNGRPPAPGEQISVRGGSYRLELRPLTARDAVPPDTRAPDLGFRCVAAR